MESFRLLNPVFLSRAASKDDFTFIHVAESAQSAVSRFVFVLPEESCSQSDVGSVLPDAACAPL